MRSLSEQAVTLIEAKMATLLTRAFLALCLVGLPMSLYRWVYVGFLPIYIVHVLATVTVLFIFLFPSKEAPKKDIWKICAVLFLLGIVGSLQFGLQSGTQTFIALVVLIATLIWGKRAGIALVLIWLAILIAIAAVYVPQLIDPQVPPEIYATLPGAWVVFIIGSCMATILIVICTVTVVRQMQHMYEKIEAQHEEIKHVADHDDLTGLPVLRVMEIMYEQEMALLQRQHRHSALLFIDMDKFKAINDQHGHTVGNQALVHVARAIESVIRSADTACRIGGDEFMILCCDMHSPDDVDSLTERLFTALGKPIPGVAKKIALNISIGCLHLTPPLPSFSQAIHLADNAMYRAKQKPGNTCCLVQSRAEA